MPLGVYIRTEEHREKLRVPHKGSGIYQRTKEMKTGKYTHQPWSAERKIKMSELHKKLGTGKWMKYKIGEDANNWKGGLNKNRDKHSLVNQKYVSWRTSIFTRDNFKCKISNQDCKGQLEAHHILRWADYPELRYEVNNGITLCHFHHPRKIKDEMRLSPYFQELVKVKV